jgi:hypothetical protein
MGDKRVIGPPLAFFGKIEKRLGHLEEHLDVPILQVFRSCESLVIRRLNVLGIFWGGFLISKESRD